MRIARRPEDLGTGSLLFAPRLAPRLRAEEGALDFGLPELSAVTYEQVKALLAGRVEMRGKQLLVLLVFVDGSRPLMVQADKLRLDSFELEVGAPLENLRTLITWLGGNLDPVTEAATQAFAEGGEIPDLGAELIPLASWIGEVVASPARLAEALGIEAPEAEEASEGTEEPETSEETEGLEPGTSEEPAPPEVASTPPADPTTTDEAPAIESGEPAPTTAAEPSAATEQPEDSEDKGRLWLDLARQQLVTIGEGYLLVARRNARELRTRSEAVRSGRDPRVVFGTDALTIPFPKVVRVRNAVTASRLELIYRRESGTIREVIDYTSPEEGERMFEQLAESLGPDWHRQRVVLSRWQALYHTLRWPLVAAVAIALVFAVLALRPSSSSTEPGAGQLLGPYGLLVAGLMVASLVLWPLARGLRQEPPTVEELVPRPRE